MYNLNILLLPIITKHKTDVLKLNALHFTILKGTIRKSKNTIKGNTSGLHNLFR